MGPNPNGPRSVNCDRAMIDTQGFFGVRSFVGPAWMSQEVSKWSVNGLFHLLINGVYWGYNPLILTIDPNFLGHPSVGQIS